jgi:hypothetical protein
MLDNSNGSRLSVRADVTIILRRKMQNNRLTNILLGFLVLGVWGLFLHLTLQRWTPAAEAQTKKPPASADAGKKYGLVAVDKNGNIRFDGGGTTVLSATGLQTALALAPAEGWKVNSVVFSAYDTYKGWTVIVEK